MLPRNSSYLDSRPNKKGIYTNVAACALRRWAFFAGLEGIENKRRAEEERGTMFMALRMFQKDLPPYP